MTVPAEEAAGITAHGSTGSGAIRDAARTQAAAIVPMANSPAGMRLLVATVDQHVAAMQGQLKTTTAQNPALTTRLLQVAGGYRKLGGTVHQDGYGPVPERPPTPFPETPWQPC